MTTPTLAPAGLVRLAPGVHVVGRDADHVQVGLDPPSRVIVRRDPDLLAVLDDLGRGWSPRRVAAPVAALVRSLDAVVTAQKADVGVLLSLEEPTSAARDWAAKGGLCDLPGFRPVPRLQIVTIEQALTLRERAVDLPTRAAPVRTAPREQARPASGDLFG